MRRTILISVLSAGLGACASTGTTTTATCTNLVSVEGGLLQFCQTANKIEVSETGIDPDRSGRDVKIVNDPITLQSIANKLHTSPRYQGSRSVVARACTVKDKDYVTVSVDDMERITGSAQTKSQDEARQP